jgi:hypothetical protein
MSFISCRVCDVTLTEQNATPSQFKYSTHLCKSCANEKSRREYIRNRERYLKYDKEYYARNRDEVLARAAKRRESHKDEIAEYKAKYEKNRYAGYIGACDCPKCGRRGYMELQEFSNSKTGTIYNVYEIVKHKKYDSSSQRMVYDGACFIGEH